MYPYCVKLHFKFYKNPNQTVCLKFFATPQSKKGCPKRVWNAITAAKGRILELCKQQLYTLTQLLQWIKSFKTRYCLTDYVNSETLVLCTPTVFFRLGCIFLQILLIFNLKQSYSICFRTSISRTWLSYIGRGVEYCIADSCFIVLIALSPAVTSRKFSRTMGF